MQDNNQDQRSPNPREDMKRTVSLLAGASQIVCKPLEVWLRRPGTWGDRYANYQMVLGWLFMWFFGPLFFPQYSQRGMLWFSLLTTVLMLVHRLTGLKNWRIIAKTHSRYSGKPWLPGDEARVKTSREPLLVICVAPFLIAVSPPLGVYLLIAGFALGISTGFQASANSARLRALRDAKLDQQWLMSEMREEE